MNPMERSQIIASLTQEKLLQHAADNQRWPKKIGEAYQIGDHVKLILDKETGPDTHLHGRKGEIIDIEFDDASSVTGDSGDNFIYTIELEDGEIPDIYFRRRDVRLLEEDRSA
jgi:ribosomal protein L21E